MYRSQKMKKEHGVALIITLVILLVLSTLIASLIFVTNTSVWASANYKMMTQARYTAETGAQVMENWLIHTYATPSTFTAFTMTTSPVTASGNPVVLSSMSGISTNYPDTTTVTAFNTAFPSSGVSMPGVANATYTVSAKLLSMTQAGGVSYLGGGAGVLQTWQITSVGSISGVRSASVQVVETIQNSGTPVYNYGLETTGTGCNSMWFASNDSTDSYNSSLGPQSGQPLGTQGNVAANGNINVASGARINGTIGVPGGAKVACPAAGVTDSSSTNYTRIVNSPLLTPPNPWGCATLGPTCVPPGTLVTTAQNISTGCTAIAGCTKGGNPMNGPGTAVTSVTIDDNGSNRTGNEFTLAPGSYGNITINAVDVVHVSAGTYNINSINFQQDGQFVVDSGPVVFNMVGNCASGGCPTESAVSSDTGGIMSSTEVIYGAGQAGFNGCANGVTANVGIYGTTTCGTAKSAYSGIPSNLSIVYGGTYTMRLGGMPNALVLYAPDCGYYTPGAPVGLYGSAVVRNFYDSSGSPFHYDTALQTNLTQAGPYQVVGFSWTKF